MHAFLGSVPADRYAVLVAIAPGMAGAGGGERFEFGRSVLIAGRKATRAAETR